MRSLCAAFKETWTFHSIETEIKVLLRNLISDLILIVKYFIYDKNSIFIYFFS